MFTTRQVLTALCKSLPALALLGATAAAQTSQVTLPAGAATVITEQLSGEVMKVEGNDLVVRMSNGELRTFNNVPDSRKALIDGVEVGVRDLKPGTRLSATITRTSTPLTVRTTTVATGRVWLVSGLNVILTLPSGENKQYTVKPDYTFNVNGRPATVAELRPGMVVSAEKIVEEPRVELTTNTAVTGQGPVSQQARAEAPAPRVPPVPVAAPVQAAPAAVPAAIAEGPEVLPKTGSQLPFVGLLGVLLVTGSYGMRMLGRFW